MMGCVQTEVKNGKQSGWIRVRFLERGDQNSGWKA